MACKYYFGKIVFCFTFPSYLENCSFLIFLWSFIDTNWTEESGIQVISNYYRDEIDPIRKSTDDAVSRLLDNERNGCYLGPTENNANTVGTPLWHIFPKWHFFPAKNCVTQGKLGNYGMTI